MVDLPGEQFVQYSGHISQRIDLSYLAINREVIDDGGSWVNGLRCRCTQAIGLYAMRYPKPLSGGVGQYAPKYP